jgi:hypothetical protein
VALESAGSDGSIGVTVTGKNLFGGEALADKLVEVGKATKNTDDGTVAFKSTNISNVTFFDNFKENTQYTFIFYGKNSSSKTTNLKVSYTDGSNSGILLFPKEAEYSLLVFTSDKGKSVRRLYGSNSSGTTTLYYDKCGIFEGVLTEADFVPYEGQTLTVSTPNGLPGIPVSSGGNYTDENGQQWVCDEVDFAKGVYAQKLLKEVFDGSDDEAWAARGDNTFSISLSRYIKSQSQVPAMCNYGYSGTVVGLAQAKNGVTIYYKSGATSETVYLKDTECSTAAELRAKLAVTPLVLITIAAEPIETPLSAEEMAQYAALHTYKPNTTICKNSKNAGMEVSYVADTKTYIDQKLTAISAAMLNA